MMGPWDTWAWLLVLLLVGRWGTKLWLSVNQTRAVMRQRDRVPSAFEDVLTLAAHHRAADYTAAKEALSRRAATLQLALGLMWTLGGGLHALERLGRRLSEGYTGTTVLLIEAAVLGVGFSLIEGVIELPIEVYRTFVVEHRFGFNRTTPAVFIKDALLSGIVGLGLGLPVWLLIVYCLGRMGPWGWAYAYGAYAIISVIFMWAGPTLIAPLFNRFTPLGDHPVRGRIDALMQRAGYARGQLFVMNGSARSTHGNAYFTGLGRAKRVVFFDTLLERLDGEEIEGVLAHELGHFALGHIQKQLVVILLVTGCVFAGLGAALGAEGLYQSLGVPNAGLPARLVLLALAGGSLSFWLTPLRSRLSRAREFEADAYACEHASGAALRRALIKLFVDNGATLTPSRNHSAFYDSHPPVVQRLARLSP